MYSYLFFIKLGKLSSYKFYSICYDLNYYTALIVIVQSFLCEI